MFRGLPRQCAHWLAMTEEYRNSPVNRKLYMSSETQLPHTAEVRLPLARPLRCAAVFCCAYYSTNVCICQPPLAMPETRCGSKGIPAACKKRIFRIRWGSLEKRKKKGFAGTDTHRRQRLAAGKALALSLCLCLYLYLVLFLFLFLVFGLFSVCFQFVFALLSVCFQFVFALLTGLQLAFLLPLTFRRNSGLSFR